MIETILRLLSQEKAAFLDLARRLRAQRAAFATSRGTDVLLLTQELAALEAPRAAAARELGNAIAELASRPGTGNGAETPGKPLSIKRLLTTLPARDRARLVDALAATRAAAEEARLQIAVGERLLSFATDTQESFLRDLIDWIGPDIDAAAMVDVKG